MNKERTYPELPATSVANEQDVLHAMRTGTMVIGIDKGADGGDTYMEGYFDKQGKLIVTDCFRTPKKND